MTPPNGVASEAVSPTVARAPVRGTQSMRSEAWRRFRKHRLATFGAAILVVMVIAVVVGPFIYRVPIDEIDFKAKLKAPSWAHPLGTDDLGQDLLARMLYGGRISLAVGVVAMLIAITVGHDDRGHRRAAAAAAVDHVLMRVTDLFLSLPQLPLLLLLVVYLFRDALKKALGPEMGVFMLMVVVIGGPALDAGGAAGARPVPVAAREGVRGGGARARSRRRSARSSATSCPTRWGRSSWPAPSTWPPPSWPSPRCPSWAWASRPTSRPGAASSSTPRTTSTSRPHWAIFPGTAIFLTVLSINYIGDGLRDALDPRKVLS